MAYKWGSELHTKWGDPPSRVLKKHLHSSGWPCPRPTTQWISRKSKTKRISIFFWVDNPCIGFLSYGFPTTEGAKLDRFLEFLDMFFSRKFSGLSHRKRIGRRNVFARSGELTKHSWFKSRFVVNWVFCQPVPPTSLTKRCDPGVEFSGNKLQTIHIISLWKASALGMKEDEMVQKFKAEMTTGSGSAQGAWPKTFANTSPSRLASGSVSRSLTRRMQKRFLELESIQKGTPHSVAKQ